MANKVIECFLPSGLSGPLLKLFDRGADTLLNTGGDTLTERTNAKGCYTCTVTEALAGNYRAIAYLSDGVTPLFVGRVDLVDAVGMYPVVDEDATPHVDAVQFGGTAGMFSGGRPEVIGAASVMRRTSTPVPKLWLDARTLTIANAASLATGDWRNLGDAGVDPVVDTAPTMLINDGFNGHPCVRFTAASSQYLTVAYAGPVRTVIAIATVRTSSVAQGVAGGNALSAAAWNLYGNDGSNGTYFQRNTSSGSTDGKASKATSCYEDTPMALVGIVRGDYAEFQHNSYPISMDKMGGTPVVQTGITIGSGIKVSDGTRENYGDVDLYVLAAFDVALSQQQIDDFINQHGSWMVGGPTVPGSTVFTGFAVLGGVTESETIWTARSNDGRTFVPAKAAFAPQAATVARDCSHVFNPATGAWSYAWTDTGISTWGYGRGRVFGFISRIGQVSTSTVTSAPGDTFAPDLTILDGAETCIVGLAVTDGGAMTGYYQRPKDLSGVSWTDPALVATNVTPGFDGTIIRDPDGWLKMHTRNSTLWRGRELGDATWEQVSTYTLTPGAGAYEGPSVIRQGNTVIAYVDRYGVGSGVRYQVSHDGGVTFQGEQDINTVASGDVFLRHGTFSIYQPIVANQTMSRDELHARDVNRLGYREILFTDGTLDSATTTTLIYSTDIDLSARLPTMTLRVNVGTTSEQARLIRTATYNAGEMTLTFDTMNATPAGRFYVYPTPVFDAPRMNAPLAVHAGTAQAGAIGTITLATTASATNDRYKRMVVHTSNGEAREITAYVGATKVATVSPNWAIAPGSTTKYYIAPAVAGLQGTTAGTTLDVSTIATSAKLIRYVALLARKDAALAADLAAELAEINASFGTGAGAYVSTTDSQEAVRDRGDAAWVTGSGGLDAAGIRDAIGMDAADLDDQLEAIDLQTDKIGTNAADSPNDDTMQATVTENLDAPISGIVVSGATLIITPILANTTNPRYSTRDLPPIAQGSEPTEIWTIVDALGAAVSLAGKTVRLVACNVTNEGEDEDSRIDDTLTGAFQYETGGDGITIGGAGNNQLTLVHDAEKTGTPGSYRYFLWNVTDMLVIARGKLTIEPALIAA